MHLTERFLSHISKTIFLSIVFLNFIFTNIVNAEILPTDVLQNGYGIFSCNPAFPITDTLAVTNFRGIGSVFSNPANLGDVDVSSNFSQVMTWGTEQFGGSPVMGVTFDSRDGRIYVATTRLFTAGLATDVTAVYTISPDGNTVQLMATLPGTLGTGWIELDEDHNQLYVSNFDDGLIYVIPQSGGVGQTVPFATFAPHAADPIDGIVPPDNMFITGVGYNSIESRLYYAVFGQATGSISFDNTIRSVLVNPDGTINPATDVLEFIQPNEQLGPLVGAIGAVPTSSPVFDIVFSRDGQRLLLAEQGMTRAGASGVSIFPHESRIFELNGSTGAWVTEPTTKHRVGRVQLSDPIIPSPTTTIDTNSRGGIDFAFQDSDITTGEIVGREDFLAVTGDALPFVNGSVTSIPIINIYGIQYHPITGGDQSTALNIDLDFNSVSTDKNVYGDIDFRASIIDRGDLPDIYGTLLASSGASHEVDDVTFLGAGVDGDLDGAPGAFAIGDGGGDEDGIQFLTPLIPGTNADIKVTASIDGYLNSFIDFDGDSVFEIPVITAVDGVARAGNLTDLFLTGGMHTITIAVPNTATGVIYSRFRFTNDDPMGALGATGFWPNGEVEDYALSAIGNFVFNDLNSNGIQNTGELGVSNILIKLLDGTGAAVLDADGNPITTVSDANGMYSFPGLAVGSYQVQFMTNGLTIQGAGGNIDSDPDPLTMTTPTVVLGAGEINDTIDAGIIIDIKIGDTVWFDANLDGIQDPSEPVIAGVTVSLFDSMGNFITSVITDVNGMWMFSNVDGLVPNEFYTVALDNPADFSPTGPLAGYALTIQNQGADVFDSDAETINGFPSIFLQAPGSGQTDFNFHFGFVPDSFEQCGIPEDCSSFQSDNPISIPWNSFLEQVNIATLRNTCDNAQSLTLNLIDMDGNILSTQNLSLQSKAQVDVIINDLAGFAVNSIGSLEVAYTDTGCVSGFSNRYRLGNTAKKDFLNTVPITSQIMGNSYSSFNTFDITGLGNTIFNWLEITNLESTPQTFIRNLFDVSGILIDSSSIVVPANGRRDLEAGHFSAGPNSSGSVEIVPASATNKYIARVVRYGSNAQNGFDFASVSEANIGTSECSYVQISTGAGALPTLVVTNLENTPVSVSIDLMQNSASIAGFPSNVIISPNAQEQIPITGSLIPGTAGIAQICPNNIGEQIRSEVFVLFPDSSTGTISSSIVKQSVKGVCVTESALSYNTFLNQQNWIRISSQCETETLDVFIRAYDLNGNLLFEFPEWALPGTVTEHNLTAPPFNLPSNSYGLIEVAQNPTTAGALVTEIIRIRDSSSLGAPTCVDISSVVSGQ